MKPHRLILPAIALCLCSCSTLKRGYDGVAKGTGAAWGAVKNAGGSVVSGTANLGKKTAEVTTDASRAAARLAKGKLKPEPTLAEITISLDKRKGVITLALDEEAAPGHVDNFRKLAKEDYYNGVGVHRAVPGNLIQMGDPRSRHESARAVWGLGGPGYTLPAEIQLKHRRGSVGMARLGDRLNPTKQSNGSEFYICLRPMPALDGEYTVFARVVSGIEFADAIANTPADDNDAPLRFVKVESVRLVDGPAPAATALPEAAPVPAVAAETPAPVAKGKSSRKSTQPDAAPAQPEVPASRQVPAPAKPKGWFGRTLDRIW